MKPILAGLLAVLLSVLTAGPALAIPATKGTASLQPATDVNKKDIVPSLLVMSAKKFTYSDGKLTLGGISPTTVVFADRPERLAGHVPTDAVIDDWAEGSSSFAKVPPNANLSMFGPDGAKNAVVELRNPVMKNGALTYDVRVLQGQLPASGEESSLFIDIIGMPLSPMSVAGVGRRCARRAVFFR